MTGNGELTCEQFRDSSAELALGVLPAQERAAAIAHLQHCPHCHEHIRELARVTDGLLSLVPAGEPPIGFETRTLERIGLVPGPQRLRRTLRHRLLRAAVGVAVALAVGLGGWAIGSASDDPAPPPTAPTVPAPPADRALLTADLTAAEHPVGQAFAYTGTSPWVYVSVDADEVGLAGQVRCRLQRNDGSTVTVGPFRVVRGYAYWGGPYPAGSAPVVGIQLLAADGSVVATGMFTVAEQ